MLLASRHFKAAISMAMHVDHTFVAFIGICSLQSERNLVRSACDVVAKF